MTSVIMIEDILNIYLFKVGYVLIDYTIKKGGLYKVKHNLLSINLA